MTSGQSTPAARANLGHCEFRSHGIDSGTYTAWLHIVSNDADEGVIDVPVTFTVASGIVKVFLPLVLRNY